VPLFDSPRQARRFLRDLTIALSLPLAVLVFLIQPFQVEGRSMQPRLIDGERILVDKISPMLGVLRRGDIIVFRSPLDGRRVLVKRVIGLPGETIAISRGVVLVGGRPLDEIYLDESVLLDQDLNSVLLGDGEYFVLGDHRNDSEDSRVWGPVPRRLIVGRAFLSYWPPSSVGSLS
jgi:signal peptidase I